MIDIVHNDKTGAMLVHDVELLDDIYAMHLRRRNQLLLVSRKDENPMPLLVLDKGMSSEFEACSEIRIVRMKKYAIAKDFTIPLLME